MSETGQAASQRKVETTDIIIWAWPQTRGRKDGSGTVIGTKAPPYCRLHIRVFMAIHKMRRYVDLVQMLEIVTLDGHLEKIPKWVDAIMVAKYIDAELKRRFPDDAISRTTTTVIDKEVGKLRAIQSNYTFASPSGVQPQLARTLVGAR
jgi:hypothetical protein